MNVQERMKGYAIPVTWTMTGTVYIEAESLDSARIKALAAPLPEGSYLSESFEVDSECFLGAEEDYVV